MGGQVESEESAPTEFLRGENQTSSESSAERQDARLSIKVADQAGEGSDIQDLTFFCCC